MEMIFAVTVLDVIAASRRGGIDDEVGDNFVGIFFIDIANIWHSSLRYYIGREVDTGPGETGHGITSGSGGSSGTQSWLETGLPQDTRISFNIKSTQHSLRAILDLNFGGDARVGAFRTSVEYRGWTERTVMLNEYRGGKIVEPHICHGNDRYKYTWFISSEILGWAGGGLGLHVCFRFGRALFQC